MNLHSYLVHMISLWVISPLYNISTCINCNQLITFAIWLNIDFNNSAVRLLWNLSFCDFGNLMCRVFMHKFKSLLPIFHLLFSLLPILDKNHRNIYIIHKIPFKVLEQSINHILFFYFSNILIFVFTLIAENCFERAFMISTIVLCFLLLLGMFWFSK